MLGEIPFSGNGAVRPHPEELQARLAAIVESCEDAIVSKTLDGQVVSWNRSAERLFGFSPQEAIGSSIRLIIPEDLWHEEQSILDRLRQGERFEHYETVRRSKEGRLLQVSLTISPVRDRGGGIIGASSIARDITARKQAEKTAHFLATASAALAELTDYETTLQKVAALAIPFFADWCAIDVLDPDGSVRRLAVAHSDPAKAALVREVARKYPTRMTAPAGVGRVIRTGASDWAAAIPEELIAKVAHDEDHLRIARELQLKSYLCVPLKLHGRIFGALSFVMAESGRRYAAEDLRAAEDLSSRAAIAIENASLLSTVRETEQRFARFMEHLPGLAWIKDLQGRYVYVNDSAAKAFRRTPEELYGKSDEDVFPAATAARFKQNDLTAVASGSGVQVIETLEHEDGITHHSIVSKFPILGAEGKVAFVGGMAIDITDRLRAEEVLAESEERFRQLAENINEVFWMTDPQTTQLLYISPAFERVWGRPCQSLHDNPRSFMEAVHPDDRARVELDVLERQSRGEQLDKEYRVVRPDGSIRWVRDRAFPVKNAAGQFYRLVGIIDDFTEKKQAEESLREANRRKDEFLATLAHELRNPLAPIRNAVELMRRAESDRTLMEQSRSMLERQVTHMVRLVDDLLDISRITSGKLQLRKRRVELAGIVRSALEAARPLIDGQGHTITVRLPQEPLHLEADPIRLAQVITNLLNNAAKYTERGGHIWLTVERQNGEAVLSVRDTGVGIAAEHLAGLFEMFSQVEPALERSQGGLGIGLALVRGLVHLHGGRVEAHSAGCGKGSEFLVHLPAVENSLSHSMPSAEVGSCGGSGRRILVVDDNRDAADSTVMVLRLMGHLTETAYDGLEAVQAAATFRPEIVLLDIGLPKMNGYEVAQHIRQQPWGGSMALIALTGWGQEEDKRRALEAGFDHHLTKPMEAVALERLLALMNPSLKDRPASE